MILQKLFTWDVKISDEFQRRYGEEFKQFVISMTEAHKAWKEFDSTVRGNEQRAHVSALIFGAINLHIMSMKLLIWGMLVPSGNIMRQVLETISMAFLASKPDLGFLARYASGQYSTNKAVRDLIKNAGKLNLVRDALETLKQARNFYDKFSHPTLMTVATYIRLGDNKNVNTYFGASFDPGKLFAYDKEVNTRIQVANLFENMIHGIYHNLDG